MKWLNKIFKKNDNLENVINIENDIVKSFTNDDVEYNINLSELSCTCKDWTLERFIYAKNDPRRLCKHLIKRIDLKTLNEDLKYFREKIQYHKEQQNGFSNFFNKIIYIEDADCQVLYTGREWNSVFDNLGNQYGISINSYGYNWTNKGKPKNYEIVEDYFSGNNKTISLEDDSFFEAIELFEDEKLLIKKLIEKDGYKNISFEFAVEYEFKPNQLIYRLVYLDSRGQEYNDDFVDVSNEIFSFSSTFSDGFTTDKVFQRDSIKVNQARKERLIERRKRISEERQLAKEYEKNQNLYNSTYSINELIRKYNVKIIGKDFLEILEAKVDTDFNKYYILVYDNFRFYDEYFLEFIEILEHDIKQSNDNKKTLEKLKKLKMKEVLNKPLEYGIPKVLDTDKKYLSSKEFLSLCNAPFAVITFYKILKQLNFIKKIEYRANTFSDYLLMNEGLKYGDNIATENSFSYIDLHNIKPFQWLIFDSANGIYIEQDDFIIHNDRKCIPSCFIMWKAEHLLELYKLVYTVYYKEKQNKSNSLQVKKCNKTSIQLEREAWLKDVECPFCQGKNIHKKDIRQRKGYQVQRYQCRDCIKIFQEEINDE